MFTLITFAATAAIMNMVSQGNRGFVPGYGTFEGMIPGWAAAISIIIVSIAVMLDISRSPRLQCFQTELSLGVLWRVFLVVFDRYGQSIFQLPNSGADSGMFYRNAALFASTGEAGRGGFFSIFMGRIFRLTGVSQFYGQFVIALFSVVAIIMLIKILDEIMDDMYYDIKRRIVMVVALLPNYAILSSVFLRESVVSMCVACSAYYIVKWMKGYSFMNFAIAFALVLLGSAFHSGSIAVAMAYILIVFMFDRRNNRIRVSIKNLPAAVVLLALVFYLYLNYGDLLFYKMLNVSSLADVGSTYSEGGSSYAAYVGDSSTPLRMILFALPRFVYFLFSPFPWQWRGINDIIAFVFSSLFYLVSFVQGTRSLKYSNAEEKKYAFLFMVIALCTAFVFSWGTTNTGTATRHREKMVIIYAVMYAIGKKAQRSYFKYSK